MGEHLYPAGIKRKRHIIKKYKVDNASDVFLSKKDILTLAERLKDDGHQISLNLYEGNSSSDLFLDAPTHRNKNHLRLLVSKNQNLVLLLQSVFK